MRMKFWSDNGQLLRDRKSCCAYANSAQSLDTDEPGFCTSRYSCGHLSVGVHLKTGRHMIAKSNSLGLSEAQSNDSYRGSDRAAGRSETQNLGRDTKLLVARERAPWHCYGD